MLRGTAALSRGRNTYSPGATKSSYARRRRLDRRIAAHLERRCLKPRARGPLAKVVRRLEDVLSARRPQRAHHRAAGVGVRFVPESDVPLGEVPRIDHRDITGRSVGHAGEAVAGMNVTSHAGHPWV